MNKKEAIKRPAILLNDHADMDRYESVRARTVYIICSTRNYEESVNKIEAIFKNNQNNDLLIEKKLETYLEDLRNNA